MIEPILLVEELTMADSQLQRMMWLRKIYGDNDPMMTRWKHHARKGDMRRHWYAKMIVRNGKYLYHVYFGHKDMAVPYKLAWGGHLVR